jgi:SH3-like domain-containing protein
LKREICKTHRGEWERVREGEGESGRKKQELTETHRVALREGRNEFVKVKSNEYFVPPLM